MPSSIVSFKILKAIKKGKKHTFFFFFFLEGDPCFLINNNKTCVHWQHLLDDESMHAA